MRSPVGITIRNDAKGSGAFGAPRGSRTHVGIDLIVEPDSIVYAPVDCIVNRIGTCYNDDSSFKLIELTGFGIVHRILYVSPCVQPGEMLREGDIIGSAQNVSKRHGHQMIPHVHWEVIIKGIIDKKIPAQNNTKSYMYINPLEILGA